MTISAALSCLHNQGDCLIDKKPLGAVLCGSRTFLYRLARYRDLSLSCRLSGPVRRLPTKKSRIVLDPGGSL